MRAMGRGQVVRHQVLVLVFGGSSPSAPAIDLYVTNMVIIIFIAIQLLDLLFNLNYLSKYCHAYLWQ